MGEDMLGKHSSCRKILQVNMITNYKTQITTFEILSNCQEYCAEL